MIQQRRRWLVVFISLLLLARTAGSDEGVGFRTARPVWLDGRETEMNLAVGFRVQVPASSDSGAVLKLACSTVYRAWVNGEFVAYGPARGPHGYYRIDELPLTGRLDQASNTVAIEVVGYNVNSYDTLDQPAFLQAEVVVDDGVVASTAGEGAPFRAAVLPDRLQKVQRYSFQRPFIEVYQLNASWNHWRTTADFASPAELSVVAEKRLLPRRVPLPQFEVRIPVRRVAQGVVHHGDPAGPLWKDRALVNIGPQLKGYVESELVTIPSLDLQYYSTEQQQVLDTSYQEDHAIELTSGAYEILDLGINTTGMLGATVECTEPTRLWMVFDEILAKNDVDFKRLGCVNVITCQLQPGRYDVESLEPYTMRYVKLICPEGACRVTDLHLREYQHPQPQVASFQSSDPQLNRLFEAGVETFRQNAVDVFMDCPSRERAGWLCDSFFTARVARDLTGTTSIEKTFYENFLLPEQFACLPSGMLPMCYPADHYDGVFIPNWSLWFVVQLEEYLQRSGDRAMVDALKSRVLPLFDYFRPLENQDGLLEKLQGWVFVEWSAANGYVQDVNYPSNMLYAGALAAAARMYQMPDLEHKASKIRETIRSQSYDGQFFVDNAVRRDGKLEVTRNRTEVCQYFAFFFQVATPETHPQLWRTLRDEFGPDRKQTKAHEDVGSANSFIGNMLRFELLSQFGSGEQILDESAAYLLYMVDRTGTLWENDGDYASCNHGFASHIVHTLYRDVLGVRSIDMQQKVVHVQLGTVRLESCGGTLPTPDGPVMLQWRRHGEAIDYRLELPPGYRAELANPSRVELNELPR